MSLAVDAELLNAATDELIDWLVVVKEALKLDIGKVDEPLILATNMFLASDDDPLNTVVEEAYEAVSAYDEVTSFVISTDDDIA